MAGYPEEISDKFIDAKRCSVGLLGLGIKLSLFSSSPKPV